VRVERGAIGPALEEHQPQAIVGVDRDAVLEAAGLGARAGDVLEAEAAQLVDGVGARLERSSDDDHAISAGCPKGRKV
jgi:hypothetical protein